MRRRRSAVLWRPTLIDSLIAPPKRRKRGGLKEAEILEEMRLAVVTDKLSGDPVGWMENSGPDQLRLTLPLDVQANTKATVRLEFRAARRSADRDVSATLVVTVMMRDFRAWRMDWRPVHRHTNRMGSRRVKGLTVSTGVHEFRENARLGLEKMQTFDLPICVPFDPEPHDFDAFVRCVFDLLRIAPTEPLLGPPWSPTFF
jgi:hypothetical protein